MLVDFTKILFFFPIDIIIEIIFLKYSISIPVYVNIEKNWFEKKKTIGEYG